VLEGEQTTEPLRNCKRSKLKVLEPVNRGEKERKKKAISLFGIKNYCHILKSDNKLNQMQNSKNQS